VTYFSAIFVDPQTARQRRCLPSTAGLDPFIYSGPHPRFNVSKGKPSIHFRNPSIRLSVRT
jgi:hypothetical protein